MENVSVLATPDAYELLTNPANGEMVQSAVTEAINFALGKHQKFKELKCPEMSIEKCPLTLSMKWAESPEEQTIILINRTGLMFLSPEKFNTAIKSGIPISIV